ncbi:MAG: hypothetical protein K8963_01620, partial [Proteobacteria bacterium]|nr:hypothetical protein [Pseudomonadota bacterium]
ITASNAIDADATPVSITITVNLAVRVNTVSAVATSDVSATVTVTSNVAATAHTLVQLANLAAPNATAIRAAVTQPLGMTATLTAHTPSEFTFTGLMPATEYTAYTVVTVGGTDSDIDDQDFTTFPAPPATITVPPATIGGNQAVVSVGSIVSGTVHALVLPATTAAPTDAAALKAATGVMQMPVSAGASVDLTFTGLTAEIAHTAYAIVSFANGGDSNMVTANFTTTVLLTLGTTTITRVAGSEIDISTSSSHPGTLFLLVLADTDTTSVPATASDLVMVTVGDMTGAYAQAFSFNAIEASSIERTAEDLTPGVGYTLYLTVANLAGEIADITTLKAQTALPEFTAPTDTVYLVKDVAYDDTVDAANNAMPDTPAQFIDPRYVGNNAPTGVIDECTLTAVDGQDPDPSNPLLQLPSGVSLEVLDTGIGCAFTGTPTIFTPSREYTFTATDDSEVGSVPVSVRIKVIETAGPSFQPIPSNLLIVIAEINRVYAEATDEMPDLTAVRVVNRGGPPESCVASTTNVVHVLIPVVSSDGETCVLVGTPAMVTEAKGYFLDATARVGGSNVTSRISVFFHVVASLTDSTPLAVVDSGQSGRLRTVLAGATEYRTTSGFSQNPFSEPGVAFSSIVSACALAPDSPPLPGGLSLHVSSDLRACVIGIHGLQESRIVTDIAEYTIIGSRGDIGSSNFQSATGTLRLEVVAGDFTTPALSISHGAADAENTVILNPSTPVAIPFANTGSKLSSTFVDACQVIVGTLPTGLSVRLATEADQNNSIAEEGETCILVGTPGATAAEAVNITISYPNTKTNNQRTSAPPLATYQFSIEVATTPGFVATD